MTNVGKTTGSATVTTAAASPVRAAGAVWRVNIDGKWAEQSGVAATAVTEADVETCTDVGRLQALASDVVRVSEVREEDPVESPWCRKRLGRQFASPRAHWMATSHR